MNQLGKYEDKPMAHAGMATDFALQEKYYEQGKIYILQIESTLRCDQKCDYCYSDSKPDSQHGLQSATIKQLLKSAASMKVKMIDWLGGDPLLRPDWYELCQYATSLGLINNIWTSGIPLADEIIAKKVEKVTKGGFISTHLDTLNRDMYSKVHGSKGKCIDLKNIKKIQTGIENCLKFGKDPDSMVNCITFTKPLANGDIKSTIKHFYTKYGIKTCLTLYNPVNPDNPEEEYTPTNDQIRENYEYRDKVNYPNDPSCGPMDVSKFYCGSVVCVTFDGWLVPCSVIRTKEFGNVKNKPFDQLVEEKRRRLLFLDFRDTSKLPGKCSSCENNSHCFGCRSSAYYYGGDILAADPKCNSFAKQKNNENLNKHEA